MDWVLIEGLFCRCHIGVSAAERSKRQRILIDLELGMNLKVAGRQDRVQNTVDYAAVAREVKYFVESHSFHLVEAMAQGTADLILKRFGPHQVRVRIRKFSVAGTESVGAEITRARQAR